MLRLNVLLSSKTDVASLIMLVPCSCICVLITEIQMYCFSKIPRAAMQQIADPVFLSAPALN